MREIYCLYLNGEHIMNGSEQECREYMERRAELFARKECFKDIDLNFDDQYIKWIKQYRMEEK